MTRDMAGSYDKLGITSHDMTRQEPGTKNNTQTLTLF